MTRLERIDELCRLRSSLGDTVCQYNSKLDRERFLSQLRRYKDALSEVIEIEIQAHKEEHCGDCISRQAVIDTIETDCSWDIFNEWGSRTPTGECIINAIKSVPSAETESCGDCISRQAVLDLAESGKLVSNGNYKSVCDAINGLPSVEPEIEKCDDCINRKDMIKKLNNLCNNICEYSKKQRKSMCDACNLSLVFDMIDNAKSVEPERKVGKWVHMVGWWECNQCHAEYTDMPTCMGKVIYEYCPMCGAKMEEVEE